ncbi:four helix bundle protein [Niabella sp.]|uniref:four helix bundle protein n=1 Tax=Niabella sp. TaxID=1962976 RepID=UPI00260F89B5|nr:four helix bundle protein [Niabella sp.]
MSTYQFSFEKLEVWQRAKVLAGKIYKETEVFPAEEKYGLVSQMRRAAVSVCANIAEGTTRQTAKDQAYFTTVSYGSLMELFSHLAIAADLGYVPTAELDEYRAAVQTLSVKLSNLKSAQLKRIGKISFIWLFLFFPDIVRPPAILHS